MLIPMVAVCLMLAGLAVLALRAERRTAMLEEEVRNLYAMLERQQMHNVIVDAELDIHAKSLVGRVRDESLRRN